MIEDFFIDIGLGSFHGIGDITTPTTIKPEIDEGDSMKMMYAGVQYIATEGEYGLPNAGKAFTEVYALHQNNPIMFNEVLTEFNSKYRTA